MVSDKLCLNLFLANSKHLIGKKAELGKKTRKQKWNGCCVGSFELGTGTPKSSKLTLHVFKQPWFWGPPFKDNLHMVVLIIIKPSSPTYKPS